MLTTAFVKQYEQLKRQYEGTLLLLRNGQEYIAIGGDAVDVSKADGKRYTLSYQKTDEGCVDTRRRLPVRYVSYKSLGTCMKQCIDAGHRVAVSEQL